MLLHTFLTSALDWDEWGASLADQFSARAEPPAGRVGCRAGVNYWQKSKSVARREACPRWLCCPAYSVITVSSELPALVLYGKWFINYNHLVSVVETGYRVEVK